MAAVNFSDGLATARNLLLTGRRAEARAILETLRLNAGPDERWLEFVNLDMLTADEVAYLEQFVLQNQGTKQTALPPIVPEPRVFTAAQMADGLAEVRAMLATHRNDDAQKLLGQLYTSAAAAQAPWLQFLVLDPPDPQELIYLEEYLRNHAEFKSGIPDQTSLDAIVTIPTHAGQIATTVMTARAMIGAGRKDDAKWLLRQVIETAPKFESTWLQLLALDPPPNEELALLEGFLQYHPQHRFAKAFVARMDVVRTVAMLRGTSPEKKEEATPTPTVTPRPPANLGDYLIRQQWVTTEQIEHALAQQRALRAENIEEPLGTLLLMFGHVQIDQLATAFAETSEEGFGSFADYLVRRGILTATQVGAALAQQSALGVQYAREHAKTHAAHQKRSTGFFNRAKPNPVSIQRTPVPSLADMLVHMGFLTREQSVRFQAERQVAFEALFH